MQYGRTTCRIGEGSEEGGPPVVNRQVGSVVSLVVRSRLLLLIFYLYNRLKKTFSAIDQFDRLRGSVG